MRVTKASLEATNQDLRNSNTELIRKVGALKAKLTFVQSVYDDFRRIALNLSEFQPRGPSNTNR